MNTFSLKLKLILCDGGIIYTDESTKSVECMEPQIWGLEVKVTNLDGITRVYCVRKIELLK